MSEGNGLLHVTVCHLWLPLLEPSIQYAQPAQLPLAWHVQVAQVSCPTACARTLGVRNNGWQRTSLTDQTSGCRISASAGDFLMSRSRHVAAFLRTMERTAPFVCKALRT